MGLEKRAQERQKEVPNQKAIAEFDQRERFIRKYGLLSFISAIALNTVATQEKPAEAAEVRSGMTWEEGFSALKDDVYTSPTEQHADAALRTDGAVYWVYSKQGEDSSVTTDSRDILKTIEQEITDKSLESFCSVHTHPVLSGEHADLITPEEAEDILTKGTTTFSVPPSGLDISPFQLGSIATSSKVEDSGGYVVNVVLDPSRVWRHRIATDADYQKFPDLWKEILDARDVLPQWSQHVDQQLATFTDEKLKVIVGFLPEEDQHTIFYFKKAHLAGDGVTLEDIIAVTRSNIRSALLKGNNPGLAAEFFLDDEVGLRLQERIDFIVKRQENEVTRWNDIVYKEWVPTSLQGEPSPELYAQLIEAYLRVGVVLESFSYDEVANDPLALCRWSQSEFQE